MPKHNSWRMCINLIILTSLLAPIDAYSTPVTVKFKLSQTLQMKIIKKDPEKERQRFTIKAEIKKTDESSQENSTLTFMMRCHSGVFLGTKLVEKSISLDHKKLESLAVEGVQNISFDSDNDESNPLGTAVEKEKYKLLAQWSPLFYSPDTLLALREISNLCLQEKNDNIRVILHHSADLEGHTETEPSQYILTEPLLTFILNRLNLSDRRKPSLTAVFDLVVPKSASKANTHPSTVHGKLNYQSLEHNPIYLEIVTETKIKTISTQTISLISLIDNFFTTAPDKTTIHTSVVKGFFDYILLCMKKITEETSISNYIKQILAAPIGLESMLLYRHIQENIELENKTLQFNFDCLSKLQEQISLLEHLKNDTAHDEELATMFEQFKSLLSVKEKALKYREYLLGEIHNIEARAYLDNTTQDGQPKTNPRDEPSTSNSS